MADIKGISPTVCMHRILVEENAKNSVESQRRHNPIMKEVVKKEIIKWLDAGIIYPISDSVWMLDKLVGKEFYCFLDGYSGYNQIVIPLEDREKNTFTCPYGAFAFRRMSFGLCNAPATFQRCMMALFSDLIESAMEVFMDDFSVFRESFQECLYNLELVLARCQDSNLVLN
ncbi:hypothetical protein A2U01_0019572 [Trifolium medium]|uniref:Reverse transcriptase domain-containing protein n=1 Tax=Trifolium medium TaxID=97028 RepID=A0A392NFD5_9FABA|nr:hypothetical protein [Trifolium medium]